MSYDAYVLLKGNIYSKIIGVVAETTEDVSNYDNSIYRNELNSNYLGRAWYGAFVQARSQVAVLPGNPGVVLRGAGANPGQVLNGSDTRVIATNPTPTPVGFPMSGSVGAQTAPTASTGRAAQTQGTASSASTASSAVTDNGPGADPTAEHADDRYNHVAPWKTLKKRTRYVWSMAVGTVWAWADEIRCVSPTPFGFASQAIPAAYPNP